MNVEKTFIQLIYSISYSFYMSTQIQLKEPYYEINQF